MDLPAMRALVRNIERVPTDNDLLSSEQIDQAISGAVKRHTSLAPCREFTALHVVGGKAALDSVPGWGQRWRAIDLYRDGQKVDPNIWKVGVDAQLVPSLWCALDGQFQLEYSRPHTLDAEGTTIRAEDFDAVAHLAASLVLRQMANLYAQQKNSTISADAVDYARLASEYFMRARDEATFYNEHVAALPKRTSARLDWDSRSYSGRGRMFQNNMRSGL